jgi:uncharacterized lipoprotein YajG
MKRNLKYLLLIMAGSVLLAGCSTTPDATQWEYKLASPSGNQQNTAEVIRPFLNDMAKDGWIFVEKDAGGWFYFKRLKS